jgi:hypothetical protein
MKIILIKNKLAIAKIKYIKIIDCLLMLILVSVKININGVKAWVKLKQYIL